MNDHDNNERPNQVSQQDELIEEITTTRKIYRRPCAVPQATAPTSGAVRESSSPAPEAERDTAPPAPEADPACDCDELE